MDMNKVDDDDDSFVDLSMDTSEQHRLGTCNTLTLSLTPQNDTIGTKATQRDVALICATIQAAPLPDDTKERTPVDICVALDVSSSMLGGDKLGLCKLTIEQLLRHLLPQDRFALIAYSDDAVIKAHLQFMTPENKRKVLATVQNLQAYGSTNISAAIALSFQELQSVTTTTSATHKVRSIFLLTDGNANRGITGSQGLLDLTKNCWNDSKHSMLETSSVNFTGEEDTKQPVSQAPSSFFGSFRRTPKDDTKTASQQVMATNVPDASPISLFSFGYGRDHNATMLRDISEATETGSYYFVQTDSDVSGAFGDALGGLVSIVAQSAVLTLTTPPSVDIQIVRVHHDSAIRRPVDVEGDGATYTVSVGDFYAEETRDILIEVTLATPTFTTHDAEAPNVALAHLLATLSYTDILKKSPIRLPKPVVCLIERPDSDEISTDNEYIAKQWIRVFATKEMEEAEKLAQRGQFVEAKRRLQGVKDLIAKAEQHVRDDAMVDQLAKDLQESMNGCLSTADYISHGSKSLAHHHQTYKRQRMSTANALTHSPYRGSMKQKLAQEFYEETSVKNDAPGNK